MNPGHGPLAPVVFYRSAPLGPVLPQGGGVASPRRKSFVRRFGDSSQAVRQLFQVVFGLITMWVGVQFYLWVRFYESGGHTWQVNRPPGVEAWLPIASLMNLKDFLLTGYIPDVHPAGMFMLMAFLGIAFLYRKAFCSWICPIGTLSEALWQFGQAVFGRTVTVQRWADIPLRSLKYILFALFFYVVVTMPVEGIRAFLATPYGIIADVKMLDFFRQMGQTTVIVLAVLLLVSVAVKNFWCRYLCPYGAMLGVLALVSPTRIRRNPAACIDCGKCSKACPASLPVDRLRSVRSAECTACMTCVSVCPSEDALDLRFGFGGRSSVVEAWAMGVGILVLFLGIVLYARVLGYWHTELPDAMYFELIPRAGEFSHPR